MESNQTKLAISLVTQNGSKYLPFCLHSLMSQTFQDFSLLVIDNGSNDNTKQLLAETFPQIKVLSYPKNLGFAKAHNQGIAWSNSEYIMVLNQDVILEPDYLAKAVEYLDRHKDAASLGGKIYYWDFLANHKTKIVDTLGLKIFKNHRVVEIAQGEFDQGQFNEIREVFGVSGACPIYRRSVLDAVKVKTNFSKTYEEYLDEDFFAYKEDVDLSYRLQLTGSKAIFFPDCIGYHDRSAKGSEDLSDKAAASARVGKDKMVKIYSYKNHLLAIVKNEFFANLIKFFPQTFWYEFKKFVFFLFFEQSTLKGLAMFYRQLGKSLKKRRYIIKNIRKISAENLARWYQDI